VKSETWTKNMLAEYEFVLYWLFQIDTRP